MCFQFSFNSYKLRTFVALNLNICVYIYIYILYILNRKTHFNFSQISVVFITFTVEGYEGNQIICKKLKCVFLFNTYYSTSRF